MKKTTKIGLWVTLLSFIGLGVKGEMEEGSRGPSEEVVVSGVSIAGGSTWTHALSLDVESAKGYHRVNRATARFTATNGHTVDLVADGTQERPWSAKLELDPATPNASFLGEPVTVTVATTVPQDEALVGQSGVLRLRGSVLYLGFDVDERRALFGVEDRSKTFEEVVGVAFVAGERQPESKPAPEEEDELPLVPALLLGGLALGFGLILLGIVGGPVSATSLVMIIAPLVVIGTVYDGEVRQSRASSPASGKVKPGSVYLLDPDVDTASVDGYHQITSLSAWLRDVGDEQIELRAKTAADKPWPDTISARGVRVGPVIKTERQGIDALVEVTMPPSETVAGKSATLVISGVVDYPDIGAVDTIFSSSSQFDIASKRFRLERQIQFSGGTVEEPSEPEDGAPEWMVVPMGLGGMLLGWGLLRSLVRRFTGK